MDHLSRRRLIGGAALGTTAVWLAPAIVSIDASSAATVPPGPDFENGFGDFGVPGVAPIDVIIPASVLHDGDLLIAVGGIRFSNSKDAGMDPPPGFTLVVPSPPPATPGGVTSQATPIATSEALRAYVWTKVWHTGDPTTYTFQKTVAGGSPTRWSAGILVFQGTSGVGAAGGQGQVGTTITAPSITTGGANRTLVFIGATSGPTTFTAPAGYTVIGQGPTNAGNPQGLIATTVQAAAGPSGVVTATFATPADPGVDDNVGFLLELLP